MIVLKMCIRDSYPKDQYMSGKLLVKQVQKFETDRLKIAKAIVKGIGINIYRCV